MLKLVVDEALPIELSRRKLKRRLGIATLISDDSVLLRELEEGDNNPRIYY